MRVELVYIQFCCSVPIILGMVSLDTLFLFPAGQQAWLCSYLVLNFFCQNQGFCSYKIILIKKESQTSMMELFLKIVNG